MRKQRRQPAFAALTDAEIEQIAQSLDGDTYAAVRARVNQPRSEGGFGLNLITDRPLERLWARKNTVEKINAHITNGEKLTLATFNDITAGDSGLCCEHPASEEIHDAIMFETLECVRSGGNSPHQLLALQRLADFPVRAEIRQQMTVINAERHGFARAREQRAQEMHTHKIEMNKFRQHVATERLDLAQPSFNVRDQLASSPPNLNLSPSPEPDLHPENPPASPSHEEQPSHSVSESPYTLPNYKLLDFMAKIKMREGWSTLPPEVWAANLRYAEKLRSGKIVLTTNAEGLRVAVEVPDGVRPDYVPLQGSSALKADA